MADLPGAGRHRATAITIGNKGYMGFGHINGTGTETIYNDWWEYDPANNSWTQKADCPYTSATSGASTILDSEGFVIDGVAYLGSWSTGPFWKYSPEQNSWTQLNTSNTTMRFTTPTSYNGKGYVGRNNSLRVYDPVTDSWSNYSGFSMPTSPNVTNWINIHSKGSDLYFIGEDSQSGQVYFWSFSVETSLWTNHGLWQAQWIYPNVFDHLDRIVVACGGWSNPVALDDVFSYDPVTSTWEQLPDFQGSGRRYSAAFTINNYAYLGTGTNGVNLSDFWRMNDFYLGTSDAKNEIELTAYPNPAIDEIHIRIKKYMTFSVDLMNVNGQLVNSYNSVNGSLRIPRGNLESGVYFYSVRSGDEILGTDKFIFKD